ncbi:MAG: ResB protein required for cytochrome C biosynthesis, partial [Verrucomicrobia bacterium]|nr:ResB protein required for cytochrome C biosynthesis [Verrucomicrobiota bacterium]
MLKKLVTIITSLRLTVACLGLGLVLVFVGTLAQVDEGLYNAQARYFKSWLIWTPTLLGHKIPIALPGGYLLGTVLLVNLLAAHAQRFKWEAKKTGIIMVHAGVILLLLGQLLTDVLSSESAMKIYLNETKSYSEDFHRNELVVLDQSDASSDEVVSIPEPWLAKGGEIHHEKLPVTLRVKNYWP